MTGRHLALGLVPWVVACAAPGYRPAFVELLATAPADTFDKVLAAVRRHYPRLVVTEREPLRIQSDWLSHDRHGTPGQRRATVYAEGRRLAVVVEVRYLLERWFTDPQWSRIGGDPGLEDELVATLQSELGIASRS
jgi:hypothetical protein